MFGMNMTKSRLNWRSNIENFSDNKFVSNTIYQHPRQAELLSLLRDESVDENCGVVMKIKSIDADTIGCAPSRGRGTRSVS